ncbi:MAG: hypothetical protein ACREQJ_06185 [Candidatus Binatia bacterium]
MAARRTAIVVLLLGILLPARGLPEEGRIAVIVHPRRTTRVGLDDVAQIYLRRRRFWEDGAPIVPLNLAAGKPLRSTFSRTVLRLEVAGLADYWNRQYFSGVRPPATLDSTAAVMRYVSSDPNAIGYVLVSEVDDSVRVILRLD